MTSRVYIVDHEDKFKLCYIKFIIKNDVKD